MVSEKPSESSRSSSAHLPWRMSLIWMAATLAFVITGLAIASLLDL